MTSIYARVMPKFYVNVLFEEVPEDSFFIGGEPRNDFVRITMDHIARAFPSKEGSKRFFDAVNELITPWVKDRGFDWEFHIDETPFDLWSIQGFYPAREGTQDEKR
ncbi:MAG: tautomerase family protein [Alphaproteobacteria bacterium]|nr:tautomerase family protein [Alphaproteobacteria bacterium]MBU2083447.1 tautomerase family protein [Alphaproteobacteria bacterium]MBU2143587.1 tautomerase family protein [Alphaproteobacteria bacterium]MBU2196012.1 tautomerase family protein [Alphaproteobacteria bacterium]